jgi:outer membrane protein TolC
MVAVLALPPLGLAQVSLSTVVALAQQNSSSVKLADADLRKANAVLIQTRDVYIPNLVFGSSIGPPSIGFPAGQPSVANASMQSLAYSVQQHRYIQAAEAGVHAASLSLKDAQEQVALDASNDYIELDTVSEEIAAGEQQSQHASRLVQIESERQQAGVDSMSDLLQARLTSAELKVKLMHLQSRAASLIGQIVSLTGLPAGSIRTDHASIPVVPEIKPKGSATVAVISDGIAASGIATAGIEAAEAEAQSRQDQARGDELASKIRPLIAFGAQYNRDATSLNNYNLYYGAKGTKFKADNFSAGFSIQIPVFDLGRRAKSQQSAAEALRATVEAEQARRQNDVQIATLIGSLQELEALAEVASLKEEIAAEQVKAVRAELETGNGAGVEPGAPPQQSPKAEQLALIDESGKKVEALDAGFDLTRARLNLLRALGHISDWLAEMTPFSLNQAQPQKTQVP